MAVIFPLPAQLVAHRLTRVHRLARYLLVGPTLSVLPSTPSPPKTNESCKSVAASAWPHQPSRNFFRMAEATDPAGEVPIPPQADSAGEDAEVGFSRPEFGKEELVGTANFIERHVFLCYKGPAVWPPKVEGPESDRLPRLLAQAISNRTADMKKKTALTVCEGEDGTDFSNGDVLIFPDMVRYRNLTHFDVDTFVEEALVRETGFTHATSEKLEGSYVFVCAHGSRDKRCGFCGPILIKQFEEEINASDLKGKVHVSGCSHIGGHKYAGNVIIFSPNINGEVTGHWYGYVGPNDVPLLLELHIRKGEIVNNLWRGQMGLSKDQQRQALEFRLAQNSKMTEAAAIDGGGCCQGTAGAACCQNLQNGVQNDVPTNESIQAEQEAKPSGKDQPKDADSKKSSSTRKPLQMPTWLETWERADTYAALAVVTAAAAVFVAYSCYKHLK